MKKNNENTKKLHTQKNICEMLGRDLITLVRESPNKRAKN